MLGDSAAMAEAVVNSDDAEDEDAAAAEPLAHRRGRQQQHGECEGVGVDRPLQAGQPGMEVDPDDGQCRRHHQVVQ